MMYDGNWIWKRITRSQSKCDSNQLESRWGTRSEQSHIVSVSSRHAQCFTFPLLIVSVTHNTRICYFYLGINKRGIFHIWDEKKSKCESQEVAACLLKRFCLLGTIHYVIIYSDLCTSQKWNIEMVFSLLRYVCSPDSKTEVTGQKFLVSGHCFHPNDSDCRTKCHLPTWDIQYYDSSLVLMILLCMIITRTFENK